MAEATATTNALANICPMVPGLMNVDIMRTSGRSVCCRDVDFRLHLGCMLTS